MKFRIGEEQLGEFARKQIDAARRDPRLERGRGASVADYWDALEEAERVRMLDILGLHELQHALDREEQRLGVSRNDEDLDPSVARRLQAYWERSEMARVEIANDHPHLNAQALVSFMSALDALVEEFVPSMRSILAMALADKTLRQAEAEHPDAAAQLTPELRERFRDAAQAVLEDQVLPKPKRLSGGGATRYETRLEAVQLQAPDDRPIPADLDQALNELGALRNVLVHRAGRVDKQALEQAPSLRYQEGDLVRVSRDDYRTYTAAVRCYGAEVVFRSMRSWPEVSDGEDGPNLSDWRGYVRINA